MINIRIILVLTLQSQSYKLEKWIVARKKHKLSDKHVQMARELGLNPDKPGKIDNHNQEPWKAPLKEFIEDYFKQFKKSEPDNIRSRTNYCSWQEKGGGAKEKKTRKRQLHTPTMTMYCVDTINSTGLT